MSTPVTDQGQTDSPLSARIVRGPIGIAGVLVAAGSCLVVGGVVGVGTGIAVLVGGLVAPSVVAFGLGLAGVLTIAETAPLAGTVAAVAIGSVFIDEVMTYTQSAQQRILVRAGVVGVLLSVGTLLLISQLSLGEATGAVIVGIGSTLYLIHRYTRVTLGLEQEEANSQ